jgi:DNA-binding NarL/FixJ family response regulator
VRRFGATTESSDATEPAEPKRLTLTIREQDVLRCLSRGLTYDQVASELGISSDTIRHHIRNIYKKLQVHSATEAVSRAVREGLI